MAAAALSRSRGVFGVNATKGLFFILSLLCLVSLSSSLIDKDKLDKLKKKLQKSQEKLAWDKAEMVTTSEIMNSYMKIMDPLTALATKASGELPKDFPPMGEFMHTLKGFMEKTKTYVDGQNDDLRKKLKRTEQELGEMSDLIKLLEEQQAEL